MKKTVCICLVVLMIMFSLTSCLENECEEPILAIESNYDKKIISKYGLYYKDEKIDFYTLFENQLKKDNKEINNEAPHYLRTAYYQGKVFFSYSYDFGKIIIGYIDSSDYSITNSYVTSESTDSIYFEHINDYYCIYSKGSSPVHNQFVEYFVYDYRSNSIVEFGSDADGIDKSVIDKYKKEVTSNISERNYVYNGELYQLRTRNGDATIEKDGFNVVINYDYVLERSATLKEIDNILVEGKKGTPGIAIFAINEVLYIALFSEFTMFGRGDLIPVIFTYDIATDTFEYIGATPYYDIIYIE